MSLDACDSCMRRAWLLARLSGHLDVKRGRVWELLGLSDDDLIGAVGGNSVEAIKVESATFHARQASLARRHAEQLGLELVCVCAELYPSRLRELAQPPAVLHVAGGLGRFVRFCAQDPVALVGARKASAYGTGVARSLGRGLGTAGITVVSGMAAGIDSAAHHGALEAGAATIAVLPGPANSPYPPGNAGLYRKIAGHGVAISEIAPDTPVRSWMFPARNRLIAALGSATVVVQAAERSGSLLTVRASGELNRPIGAVPGPVTSRLSTGPNRLLAQGAAVIRDAQDVLDLLYGVGTRSVVVDARSRPTSDQSAVLEAVAEGIDTVAGLVGAGVAGGQCLQQVAALELSGHLRRGPGGVLSVIQ